VVQKQRLREVSPASSVASTSTIGTTAGAGVITSSGAKKRRAIGKVPLADGKEVREVKSGKEMKTDKGKGKEKEKEAADKKERKGNEGSFYFPSSLFPFCYVALLLIPWLCH
jgi:hypothetical protein